MVRSRRHQVEAGGSSRGSMCMCTAIVTVALRAGEWALFWEQGGKEKEASVYCSSSPQPTAHSTIDRGRRHRR